MAVRGMRAAWLTLGIGGIAGACGARTGDELPSSLVGDFAGLGGASGRSDTGSTAETASRATSVVGGPGGPASTASGTTGSTCVPTLCQCADCYSTCVCNGNDEQLCLDSCEGGAVTTTVTGTSTIGFGSMGTFGSTATVSSVTSSTTGGGFDQACCVPHTSIGCSEPLVVSCVCASDPFCCQVAWDEQCVAEVETLACGTCANPFGGAGGAVSVVTVSGTGSVVTGFTGITASATVSTTGTTGEGGSGGVAECVQQAESECEACLCTGCFREYGACIGDFGCPVILECIEETGCTTAQDCNQEDTCAGVIERFGGLSGASVAYVGQLIACASNAGCACD